MQLSCLLSTGLWARTDVLTQRCQRWALAGRIPCSLVGSSGSTCEHISRFVICMESKQLCINKGYIPEYSRGISRDHADTTRGRPSLQLISRIASLQLLVWNGKDTRLKPNQKLKIEQKTKSQIVKLKENKKRFGLVLRLLGLCGVSTCWFPGC